MLEDVPVTVFRSAQQRECNERLLVLTAVGVEALVATAPGGGFLLQVAPGDAADAVRHLSQYDAENPPPPPLPPWGPITASRPPFTAGGRSPTGHSTAT